jgi:hypothetical protein
MVTETEAAEILVHAEAQLRALIQRELDAQRYSELGHLASLADSVAKLARQREQLVPEPAPTDSRKKSIRMGARVAGRKSMSRGIYPKYARDGDRLVKIGWSKKNKTTYEHRAPRETVLMVARYLSGKTDVGKTFSIDNLLPIPDEISGGEVPAYQVYLALGWMRAIGLVKKEGRDGYSIQDQGLKNGAIGQLWKDLPRIEEMERRT